MYEYVPRAADAPSRKGCLLVWSYIVTAPAPAKPRKRGFVWVFHGHDEASGGSSATSFDGPPRLQASVLPKSPLGEALGYAIRQRPRPDLFLTDPRIPIHNDGSERRVRVVALGRKNYLFVGHARADRNIAGLDSLVGSCIANGVEPTEYLIDVLPRIAGANSPETLDALLSRPLEAEWASAVGTTPPT